MVFEVQPPKIFKDFGKSKKSGINGKTPHSEVMMKTANKQYNLYTILTVVRRNIVSTQ